MSDDNVPDPYAGWTDADFRAEFKRLAKRMTGGTDEEAERVLKRTHMRLGGASHDEALAAHPRIEPKRDRDGVIR